MHADIGIRHEVQDTIGQTGVRRIEEFGMDGNRARCACLNRRLEGAPTHTIDQDDMRVRRSARHDKI